MIFFINAYNLKMAGGLNVGLNFLNQLTQYPEDIFYVFAPANCGYEKYQKQNVKIFIVPQLLQSYFLRYYLDYVWMKRKVKEINPDVIFSMGNFALPIKSIPQGVLFHYPYLIYPKSKRFKLSILDKVILIFQEFTFRRRLKFVTLFFPQTKVAGERLKKYYSSSLNVFPVPNAYTKLSVPDHHISKLYFDRLENNVYLLALTKYYTHKNLEILIGVAKRLKLESSNIKIIITINAAQHKYAHELLSKIDEYKIGDYLINVGPVNIYDVPDLYEKTDGLILPTLLESFTATYVDAMKFGKPIFTTDIDFAREICGDAAFYFDSTDEKDVYKTIFNTFKNQELIDEKVQLGLKRSDSFPEWKKVADMYIQQLKLLKL